MAIGKNILPLATVQGRSVIVGGLKHWRQMAPVMRANGWKRLGKENLMKVGRRPIYC
ncbi:unnamed protein product, partial [Nesidiocoris tenuis]